MPKQKILVATKNHGKFNELTEILQGLEGIELVFLRDYLKETGKEDHDFEETGDTFEHNATQKAEYYFNLSNIPTIGEDSGIFIQALEGELGVKTRRWGAGEHASDEEWIEHFLDRMKDVPREKKNAKFVSVMALIFKENEEPHLFRGETKGLITDNLEAPLVRGVPLSSCFRPVGSELVYSALSENEKNEISHRGKAGRQLKVYITEKLLS